MFSLVMSLFERTLSNVNLIISTKNLKHFI